MSHNSPGRVLASLRNSTSQALPSAFLYILFSPKNSKHVHESFLRTALIKSVTMILQTPDINFYLSMLSIAMVNTITKTSVWGPLLEGSQGGNLGESCFLACSSWLACSACFLIQSSTFCLGVVPPQWPTPLQPCLQNAHRHAYGPIRGNSSAEIPSSWVTRLCDMVTETQPVHSPVLSNSNKHISVHGLCVLFKF